MPTPAVLDLEPLLAPIPGDRPTGVDLRASADPAYHAAKDARSAARAAERQLSSGENGSDAAPADWRPVLANARKVLAGRSKDLEIAAYLIEALVRIHGFAGLRDGFRLARELVERYWDDLYPLPDEDGLETRVAPLVGLNGQGAEGALIAPIGRVPLTGPTGNGRLSCVDYQRAQATARVADPDARERRIAQGSPTLESFRQAVAETSPEFFAELVGDLAECLDEFARYDAALSERCGEHAPPSSSIREAIRSCLDVVNDTARDKLPAAAAAPPAAHGEPATAAAPTADGPAAPAGAIRTREDAFAELLRVAEYFRRAEPQSIVPFALEQVVRWGRMPLPDLLNELIRDDGPRRELFRQVGIGPPPGQED